MKQKTCPSQKGVLKLLEVLIYTTGMFFSQICWKEIKVSRQPLNSIGKLTNQAGREVFLRPLPVESTVWVLVTVDGNQKSGEKNHLGYKKKPCQ